MIGGPLGQRYYTDVIYYPMNSHQAGLPLPRSGRGLKIQTLSGSAHPAFTMPACELKAS